MHCSRKGSGDCVLTSEINKDCLITYKANFNDDNHIFIMKNILELTRKDIPDHDLLGWISCQPYIAGLGEGT